jgi:LmeA-like phospholipid-binding
MRRAGGGRRVTRIALGLTGAALLLLVLAQLFLPRIAASKISSRVGRYGHVERVHVSAWPAVELLWGDADSVSVRASRLTVSPAQAAHLLWEGRGADRMELTARSARLGPLALTDVRLHKRGRRMSAHAHLSAADVKAALPPGFDVQLLGSRRGQVEVSASGGLFGVGASVDALAGASGGRLVAHPRGLLLQGLQLMLFSDPHVYVEGVAAQAAGGPGGAPGYLLSVGASLR